MIDWTLLCAPSQVEEILALSEERFVMVFKHSSRCWISRLAKSRLEESWDFSSDRVIPFFLDVLTKRPISKLLAERLNVFHESPQLLMVRNGVCIFHSSHSDISIAPLKAACAEP